MNIFHIDYQTPDLAKVYEVGDILIKGGVVALPTETVYGLAVDINNPEAIEKLVKIKNRPENKPFPIQVYPLKRIYSLTNKAEILPNVYRLIDKFWPGPLTVIFPSLQPEKFGVKVGIRISMHKVVQEILSRNELVVYMPSANPSGMPPAKSSEEVLNYFSKDLSALVISQGVEGIPSTVVDITQNPWKILREGTISERQIRQVERSKRVVFVCTGNSCRSVLAEYYLKKLLLQREETRLIEVMSCGVMVVDGIGGPTSIVVEMLRQEGVDASKHIRRAINESMLMGADLIFVMEQYHEDVILRYLPFLKNRIYLLGEFANDLGPGPEIPDPIGGSWEVYEEVFAKIKESVNRISQMIL